MMPKFWRAHGRKISIRTQLFWSFSLFIMLLMFVTLLAVNTVVSRATRTRVLHSIDQSFDQSCSFLQQRVDMMMYVANLLGYSGDLQRILMETAKGQDKSPADEYRDFLVMDRVLNSVEVKRGVAFVRIYVSDEMSYANNIRHFDALTTLVNRPDFRRIAENAGLDSAYLAPPEYESMPSQSQVEVMSLLRVIRAGDGSGIPLCVEQVAVKTSQFREIIDNMDNAASGYSFLLSQYGEIIRGSSRGDAGSVSTSDAGAASTAAAEKAAIALVAAETGSTASTLNEASAAAGRQSNWMPTVIAGERSLIRQTEIPGVGWRLVTILSEREINRQAKQLTLLLLALTVVAISAAFLASWLISSRFSGTLDRLRNMMHQVREGRLDIETGAADTREMDEIFQDFAFMTDEIKTLLEDSYRNGIAVKSAQLRALQAQINPHFLYNTLDLINWQALDARTPAIAEIAKNLARFYRVALNRGSQIVSVEEELRLVRSYVEIENCHFNGAIRLTCEVPPDILELACLNILLQPLVENAIKHGIAKDLSMSETDIVISAARVDRHGSGGTLDAGGDILFTVTDDGPGMTQEKADSLLRESEESEAQGYGVRSIQSRIRLCYGTPYGLTYRSSPGQGTTVELRIPAFSVEEAKRRIT